MTSTATDIAMPATTATNATTATGAAAAGSASAATDGLIAGAADRRAQFRADVKTWAITCTLVAALFALLQNPYWVPGGDSEVYVGSAINLARGNGYLFNGQATRIAPPGWSMLLAVVIKYVSPTFLAVKLITMASMLGALATFWWVLRRFASAALCSAIILLSAIVSHVYSLTFWLHADALFALITALSLLLAMQIGEGKRDIWRIVGLLLLCVAAVLVRWAGVINVVVLAAALLHGELWPTRRSIRSWVETALVVAVSFASLWMIRIIVRDLAPPRVPFEATADMDLSAVPPPDMGEAGTSATETPIIAGTAGGRSGYTTRIMGFGTWYSYLLWQPLRMAAGIRSIWWIAVISGWIVAGIIAVAAWHELLARRWLLPATVAFVLALCIAWPHATARYLVPITPLILLSIVRGIELLVARSSSSRRQRIAWRTIGIAGIGSVVLCNLALYGIDVWIMRSRDFYARYEAGMNQSLIAAAEYLGHQHVGNWQTCVNTEYRNLNKRRYSDTSLRIVSMLTGKAVLTVPRKYIDGPYKIPGGREFRREVISRNRVSYYLEQPPVSPWRVWHFRMPWLQKFLTGAEPIDTGAGWKLYRCVGAEVPVLIDVPPARDDPRRIPGF